MLPLGNRNWQLISPHCAPSVALQIMASLTDDSRGFIYNYNMFKAQATARMNEI